MKEYRVTINCDAMYGAIITAENEEEAEEKALELFNRDKSKFETEIDDREISVEEHFTEKNCPHSYVRPITDQKILKCFDCNKEFKPPTV